MGGRTDLTLRGWLIAGFGFILRGGLILGVSSYSVVGSYLLWDLRNEQSVYMYMYMYVCTTGVFPHTRQEVG